MVSDDQRIRVWDTATGKERLRMLQDSIITNVQVSSNGQWIATTGDDKTVRVWNAGTGAKIFQIPLGANGSALAFNQAGKYLVPTACSRLVRNLDAAQWRTLFGDQPYRTLCENLPVPE